MIKYDYKITVNKDSATLDKDIYLYKGNKNVHYYFTVEGASFAFKQGSDIIESSNAIFAGVTVIKPNGVEVATAVAPVENGKIHLKVTEDLIDEDVEIGDLDLVFDLFDEADGAVTIPKISGQFHVKDRPCTTPIGTLQEDINVVNLAVVDVAYATNSNEQVIIFDDNDNYVKTVWMSGNRITAERLNKIEEGIHATNELRTQINEIVNQFTTEQTSTQIKLKYNNVVILTIPLTGEGGDITPPVEDADANVVGSISSNNVISLNVLNAGTYTLKYEDDNGILSSFADIGTVEVSN